MAVDGGVGGQSKEVREVLRDQQAMETDRSNFDSLWQEVGELVLPRFSQFTVRRAQGQTQQSRQYDSTAQFDCERFAAAMESMMTPRTQRWHKLSVKLPGFKASQRVSEYLDDLVEVLFGNRYAPNAGFASASFECYLCLGGPGNMALEVIDDEGKGLAYRAWNPEELYFEEDWLGRVHKVHRRYTLKAWQVLERADDPFAARRWTLSDQVRRIAASEPNRELTIVRCVKPNPARQGGRLDAAGMPWVAYDVIRDTGDLVFRGGYRVRPVAVSRFTKSSGETYGRGPGVMVLPDVKMLQEMYRRYLRSLELQVEPPLLAYGEGFVRPVSVRAGAINWGTLDGRGQEYLKALQIEARLDFSEEACDAVRARIHEGFYVKLFQYMAEQSGTPISATEAMLRNQEKAQLLAPAMGRQLSEFLGPVIEREVDVLAAAGALPEMPEELLEAASNAGRLDVVVEYTSPLARLMRAEEGAGIMRTVEVAGALTGIDKTVVLALDAHEILRQVGEIWGAPARTFRSREEVKAMAEREASMDQVAQVLQGAELAGGAAEKLARAESVAAQSRPPVQAPVQAPLQ